jgi:hypothetical protein
MSREGKIHFEEVKRIFVGIEYLCVITLIKAMEDGFLYEEFKATKLLNTNFTIVESIRTDKKLGEVPRTSVVYKGEVLAFAEGVDREAKARSYIQTYGYLAEWTYLKYKSGVYVNWTESLRVTV